jgi:hypothetical protein
MRAAGLSVCGALAVLAACSPVAPARAATGLEPGVHVDPGSPAEKQYVLTLNQARQTGASSSTRSNSSPQLFGSGITPPRGGGGSSPASLRGPAHTRGTTRHKASVASGRNGQPQTASLPAAVLRASRSQGSSAGSGSTLALLAGGLAVLVLGAFGGTVLRHSRRPTPSA